MTKTTNVEQLTNHLLETYDLVSNKEIEHEHAKTIARISSKIIGAAALNLSYNKYMKINKPIKFLETK